MNHESPVNDRDLKRAVLAEFLSRVAGDDRLGEGVAEGLRTLIAEDKFEQAALAKLLGDDDAAD